MRTVTEAAERKRQREEGFNAIIAGYKKESMNRLWLALIPTPAAIVIAAPPWGTIAWLCYATLIFLGFQLGVLISSLRKERRANRFLRRFREVDAQMNKADELGVASEKFAEEGDVESASFYLEESIREGGKAAYLSLLMRLDDDRGMI